MVPDPPSQIVERHNLTNAMERLSDRQIECLLLVFKGLKTKHIAAELKLTPGTVDAYISTAMSTLGVRNRRDAARIVESYRGQINLKKSEFEFSTVAPSDDAQLAPKTPGGWWLPVRQKGATGNDLSPIARIVAVIALIIVLAVAFGTLANGVRVVSDVIRDIRR